MANTLACLLLPLQERNIILPSSAIAEIITYEKPQELPDSPHWFLGILTWRGIQIPLTRLEKMESHTIWHEAEDPQPEKIETIVRIAVLNRVSKIQAEDENFKKSTSYPFFAIVLKHNPKLYRISSEDLHLVSVAVTDDFRFLMEIKVQSESAFIPNLTNFWKIIDALPSRLQWFRKVII